MEEVAYREKMIGLAPWMGVLLGSIKGDMKSAHLLKDVKFARKYFPTKDIKRIPLVELTEGYKKALVQEEPQVAEKIAAFMVQAWLTQEQGVYKYFEKELSKITAHFDQLKEIDEEKAREIMDGSIDKFRAEKTYLFVILNEVVHPPEVIAELKEIALGL